MDCLICYYMFNLVILELIKKKLVHACRCRHGFFHVVNNDYTQWEMYAIGGSASPTIFSQGNRFLASDDKSKKEVRINIHTTIKPETHFFSSMGHMIHKKFKQKRLGDQTRECTGERVEQVELDVGGRLNGERCLFPANRSRSFRKIC